MVLAFPPASGLFLFESFVSNACKVEIKVTGLNHNHDSYKLIAQNCVVYVRLGKRSH